MSFAIYGAYGYTGELAAREAVRQGLKPVLMGRREDALKPIAQELGLEHVAVSLDDEALVEALKPHDVVLHCAGPFHRTWKPMALACAKAGTHYLDVTGEIVVFEAAAGFSAQAKEAGIAVIPGVGFDVVPTDCLAAWLADKQPNSSTLNLALLLLGEMSRGTATTVVEGLGEGGAVRRNGRIEKVGNAHDVRDIDFGRGPVRCTTIPWGDVSTAFHTTGIPNIAVYASLPSAAITGMRLLGGLGPRILGAPAVQDVLLNRIKKTMHGPSDEARAKGKSVVWGEVVRDGATVEAVLTGPEGYTMTVLTALNAVRKCLAGDVTPGFHTPAGAWGADFVLEVDGVVITQR